MGKTELIINALLDPTLLKFVYDRIYIFSGTFRTQYDKVWSRLSSKGVTVYESLEEDVLMKIYEQQLGSKEHVLILSDDMDVQWGKIDQQLVNKLITNSRHCGLSMIFLCQKMTMCPTIIRGNCDCLVAFATSSIREADAIFAEFSHIPKKDFLKFFCSATAEPYAFIVLCIQQGKFEIFKGWDQKIY